MLPGLLQRYFSGTAFSRAEVVARAPVVNAASSRNSGWALGWLSSLPNRSWMFSYLTCRNKDSNQKDRLVPRLYLVAQSSGIDSQDHLLLPLCKILACPDRLYVVVFSGTRKGSFVGLATSLAVVWSEDSLTARKVAQGAAHKGDPQKDEESGPMSFKAVAKKKNKKVTVSSLQLRWRSFQVWAI